MRYDDASGAFQASGPVANDDADTLSAGERGPATGNLITGEGTQYASAGADSAAGAHITAIAGKGGEDTSFAAGKLSVEGEHGRLTVDADGNYSYLAKGNVENVRDRFTYTLADNGGNSDTAALIIEIGKTPAVIKANAQQIVPGPDGVVTLPPGVDLSDVHVVGRNLVIDMPDGTQLIIIDGAIFVPQLVLGGVEVPATNVAALLIGQEVQPAAGEIPPSSGGNFALPPPPLDPGIPLGDLIPPTEYNYIPPEPQEVFDILDREPEAGAAAAQLDDDAQNDGNPGGVGDDPGSDIATGSLPGSGGDGQLTWDLLPDGSLPNGTFSFADQPNGDVWILQNGIHVLTVSVDPLNGDYTVTQVAPIDHPAGSDENNLEFVINYNVIDADGDVANGTLTVNVDDDTPIAVVEGQVTGLVDEDDLPAGNNDNADGDDDPGNADGDNDGTTTAGAAGSLSGLFSFGADQPGTIGLGTNTSGMTAQGLTSNGVALTYAVVGDTLTASAGGSTVFTLTVNADGSWSFDLEGQLDHSVADTEDNLDIDFSSMIVGTDHDGDTASLPNDTFVITVDDDLPVAVREGQVTGLVDEDDLPAGNHDNADGDDDPGNADGDGDGTTTGGDAGSLSGLFSFGADQPGTVELSSDTSGLPALTSNGVAVTYAVQGNVLTASAGGSTVFTLTVNPDGSWVFDLEGQLDHSIAGTEDNLDLDFSSVIIGVDADGDTATLPPESFVVDVDDDMPQEFEECPEDVITVNEPGSSFTGDLNLPPVGADDPGVVSFGVSDGDPVLDNADNPVTANGVALFYFINDDGVLEARVGDETGDVIFTITLNGDGTFTYEQVGSLGEGGQIDFEDLTSASAGNVEFRGVGADDPATTVDLLLSGEAGGADASVNTDSDSIGTANQSMDNGETMRIDLVSDLTTGAATPSGFGYSGHVSSNSFIQLIPQVQGSQTETVAFTVWALNTTNTQANEPDRDPSGGFSDSSITSVTEVTVKDYLTGQSTTVDVTGFTVGVFTPVAYGISARVNADGSVTFSGIQQGDSYGINTGAGEFNAVAVQSEPAGTGGSTQDSFDLGIFSIGVANEFEPVDLQVPIVLTDADGDPVVCDIDIHIGPPLEATDITVTVNEAGLPLIGSDSGSNSETQGGDLQGQVSGGTGPYTFAFAAGESGDGTYGTLTLNPDGTFSYTLETPFDSQPDADDGTNPELGAESFQVVATDSLGATQTITINVNIIDDVPTAVDDTDSIAAGQFGPVDGNVITDASPGDSGDSDDGADTKGADGAAVVGVAAGDTNADLDSPATVGVEIQGTYGKLTLNADGSYSYTRDAGTPGGVEDVFTYTIEDGDGDQSNATLTITIANANPTLPDPAAVLLDDDALAGGNPGGTGDDVDSSGTPGQLVGSGGDGDLDYNFTGLDTLPAGFSVNVVNAGQIQILQGATVVLTLTLNNETGAYSVVQNNPIDHLVGNNENNYQFLIGVEVEDVDGDTEPATITINVDDDTPTATNDVDSIVGGSNGPATGNVITGIDIGGGDANGTDGSADSVGADGGAAITQIQSVNVPANIDTTPNGSNNFVVNGQYGTLTINTDGSYSYLRNDGSPGDVQDVFTYTLTDGDGDLVTATLTINIGDAAPVLPDPALVRLDDDALAGGNPGGTGDDPDSAGLPGQLNGSGGDGTLTYNFTGSDTVPAGFTVNPVNATTVQILQGATVVLTVTLNQATGAFNVVQNNPIDHLAGSDENNFVFSIGVEVEDADGDVEPATITINVDDDTPTVSANAAVQLDDDALAGGNPGGTGDVNPDTANLTGTLAHSYGADGGSIAYLTTGAPAGFTYEASGDNLLIKQGGVTVITLTLNTATGAYTVVQNAPIDHAAGSNENDIAFTINYRVTDGDSDTVDGSIVINVDDDTPTVSANAAVQLDDDALTGGNPGGTGDVNPDTANLTGTLGHSFGADGAGSVAYLTTGAPAGFTYEASGDNLLIKQGGVTVVTLTLNTATGAYTVTQNAPIDHAAGLDENDIAFTINYRVTDGDGDTADGSMVINVDDDTPVNFTPVPLTDTPPLVAPTQDDALVNDGTANVTRLINDANNDGTGENFIGADGFGSLTFTATGHTDGEQLENAIGDPLTSGGDPIYVFGYGTGVLTATTSADNSDVGAVVFTVTLTPNAGYGSASTYTIDFNQTIDNGAGVTFDDLTSSAAGNVNYRGVGVDDPTTTVDLLLSASKNTDADPAYEDATVNTNVDAVGSANQSMNPGEAVRIDFVTNLQDDPTDNLATYPTGFTYDGHVGTNSFLQFIPQVQGPQSATASFTVYALNTSVTDNDSVDRDPTDGISDSTYVEVTSVTIQDYLTGNTTTLDISNDATYQDGQTYALAYGVSFRPNADGTVTFFGVQEGDHYGIGTASDFNGVLVQSTDSDFDLGVFSIGQVDTGDPVDLSFDVTATDGDGDTSTGTIDVTLVPDTSSPALLPPDPQSQLISSQTAANDDFSSLLASNDSHKYGGINSFGNIGNTGITSAMVAASGFAMMSSTSLSGFNSPSSTALVQDNFQQLSTQIVGRESVGGEDFGSLSLGSQLGGSAVNAVNLASSGISFEDHGFVSRGLEAVALGDAHPAYVPNYASGEPAIANVAAMAANVPVVSMASADMLRAASLDGNVQHGGAVEQVLADTLGNHAPTIDAVLANLPGGIAELSTIANLASGNEAGVPAWDMGMHGAFALSHDMLFKVAAVVVHQDAVQPA
jgi:T1SS-143 domain-containing protein